MDSQLPDPTQENRSQHTPVSIERVGANTITITFDDGKTKRWTATELRKACPCATCREKRRADDQVVADDETAPAKSAMLPVLSAAEARPLNIESMKPVGQYGYNVRFSDGHDSGIFVFDILYGD